MNMKMLTSIVLLLVAGCASAPPGRVNQVAAARDILSRIELDFYHFKEPDRNVAKIFTDSDYHDEDLNDDGIPECIVAYNWLMPREQGSRYRRNIVRGAKGAGDFFVYQSTSQGLRYRGTVGGAHYEVLSSKHEGFHDLSCWDMWGYNEQYVSVYHMQDGQYCEITAILYEINKDGSKNKVIKVYKNKAANQSVQGTP